MIPFGCVHSDDPGFRASLFRQCVEEIKQTPNCLAIGLGDYQNFLRSTARQHLRAYTKDENSFNELDDMVHTRVRQFYVDYLRDIRHKLIGLAEGNHYYEFQNKTTCTQYLCDLAKVPYLEKPCFLRLSVQYAGHTLRIFRLLIHHGDWSGGYSRPGGDVNAAELKALGFDFDIYIFSHCFDDKTEVLTPEGWTTQDRLCEGSVVMTYNRETQRLEWQRCEAVYRYTHFREMVQIKSRDVDLCVTDDHGLWIAHQASHHAWAWHESTPRERFGAGQTKFLLTAGHDEERLPLADCYLRLLAWIMAEGRIQLWNGRITGLQIAQSDAPDGRLQRLITDIEACGIRYSLKKRDDAHSTAHGTHRNFDAYIITLKEPKGVWRYREIVTTYLGTTKTPTVALSAMSIRQMRVFLETYVLADGSTNKDAMHSRQIASTRQDHIDWLQQIACRSGHRTSISRNNGMFYLTLNTRTTSLVRSTHWSRIPYDGIAWCVTVPNGTLLVRRGGHTAITLNTHRKWAMEIPTLTIPSRGALVTVERPRLFIRTGCFVAGYDEKCTKGYAQRKLLPPTALGYVRAQIRFYQEYDPARYRADRCAGTPQQRASRVGNWRYKFQTIY